MNHEYEQHRERSRAAATPQDTAEPGQASRSALLRKPEHPVASGLVQRRAAAAGALEPSAVRAAAAQGVATASSQLPYLDTIQRAFGHHDISSVQAHTGPDAAASASAMGAQAFATGNHVVLGEGADLHTVAHEAAHVVQQRGGVQLKGGVGDVGDVYEQHADAVADAVVAGKSAESLLNDYAGSSSASSGTQLSVQRYTKFGNVRVSDNKHLVVVDGAPHNAAYATAAKIGEGAGHLKESGSHVTMTAGAALAPASVGLADDQVRAGLQKVEPQLVTPPTEDPADASKQNDVSIVTAELYEALAKNVIASLPLDPVAAPEATLIDEMENGEAKAKVTQIYSSLDGDYNPARIAREAQRVELAPRYVRLIMQKIIEYQQQIKAELRGGGFTAPKDCGQMARTFVRGGDVRYHSLTPQERERKGYSGHYFAKVLEDGTDMVSLENAVGGSKYEQLWKASNFDAMWRFEMRGSAVDLIDDEEVHGLGESKQQYVRDPEDAQRTIDILRQQQAEMLGRVSPELTKSPEATADKNGYDELIKLVPVSADDYERERDLLIGGLAYANEHMSLNKKGRKARVDAWCKAAQAVIDRGGQNAPLAAHVIERMNQVSK